jgi:putative ABC transport system permease protein
MGFRPGAALSQGQVDSLVQQVLVQFRSIRGLRPEVADDFDLHRSEALLGELEESLNLIAKVSLVIAILALFGAGVGLMNTLLISLRERTREVGVCMALGATSVQVQTQFLCEAGMMGLLGAGLGIALGLLLGWGCAQWFGGVFVFPWGWVLWALMLSWGIALLAGSLPARRAAQLVPMEALREL